MIIVTKKKQIRKYDRAVSASLAANTQCHVQQNFSNNFIFQIITKGCKNDRGGPAFCTQPVDEKRADTSKEKRI